jgi:hypothetical protein
VSRYDRKAAVIQIEGLKCDAPGCDYEQDYPTSDAYRNWIGMPCPKCGANLLTEADVKTFERIERFARILNIIFMPLGWLGFHKKKYVYELGMDGSGKVNPKKVREEAVD